jgi:hypothetical protein
VTTLAHLLVTGLLAGAYARIVLSVSRQWRSGFFRHFR